MTARLSRKRVQGVSHRWGVSTPVRRDNPNLTAQAEWPNQDLSKGAPLPLKPEDVTRLLADFGRQEVHTQISECIDHCGHWRQVVHRLALRGGGTRDRRLLESDGEVTLMETLLASSAEGALVEARRVQWLWRHRLTVFEMIAGAQLSHEWERQQGLKTGSSRAQSRKRI